MEVGVVALRNAKGMGKSRVHSSACTSTQQLDRHACTDLFHGKCWANGF